MDARNLATGGHAGDKDNGETRMVREYVQEESPMLQPREVIEEAPLLGLRIWLKIPEAIEIG